MEIRVFVLSEFKKNVSLDFFQTIVPHTSTKLLKDKNKG